MSAPWDIWKLLLLEPDAPASLSGLPSEPALAVPAVLSPPPVYGFSVASGKLEDDVAAMIVGSSRRKPQAGRSVNPVTDGRPCQEMLVSPASGWECGK